MRPLLTLLSQIEGEPQHRGALLDAFRAEHCVPLTDDDTAVFLYWPGPDDPVADAIFLLHWVFGLQSRQPFLPLGDTGVWYLPVELPHKARVEYKLEVVEAGVSRWIRDPLNPAQAFDPFGSNSVCAMPGYGQPRWTEPEAGTRRGSIERFELASEVFGDNRLVEVYLPAEYKAKRRYPLLICHDGSDYQRFASISVVLDTLIARHEVAPVVVAFTSGHDRNREYGADPRHPEFLVHELLPALRRRFSLSDRPEDLGLMGASFGGVASLFAAWRHPGTFGKLLLQSGSFVFTDVGHHGRSPLFDPVVAFVNRFREDPGRIDAKVFLSCGTFESLIWFNRSLRPLLRDAGIDVRFVEAQDGHNWIAWRDRLRDGLTWLYPGRLWMIYE